MVAEISKIKHLVEKSHQTDNVEEKREKLSKGCKEE